MDLYIAGPSAYHAMPSKHDTSTQCWFNAGPQSLALAINHSTLDSAFCWRWCVHRVRADTDPMFVKCWASVAGAGQYPFSLVSTSCWWYQHDALNQSWVNVGPPSVTLANTGLMLGHRCRRCANISPTLGQCHVFDRLQNRKPWREMNGRQTETETD